MFQRGEPVIYRLTKSSMKPGPRAQKVAPAPQGDTYSYLVEKFWVVRDVLSDGRVVLATRRGKEHVIDADDPNLRRARWWERIVYRSRFPGIERGSREATSQRDAASPESALPDSASPNAGTLEALVRPKQRTA